MTTNDPDPDKDSKALRRLLFRSTEDPEPVEQPDPLQGNVVPHEAIGNPRPPTDERAFVRQLFNDN